MKNLSICLLIITSYLSAGLLQAQEKYDPAARAKVIAPFIDDQTYAIVHVDIARVKLELCVDICIRLIPEAKEEIIQEKEQLAQAIDSFLKAGAKDIYIGYRAGDPSRPSTMVHFILPLGKQFDQQAIENFPLFRGVNFKRSGGVLIGGWEKQEERIAEITPDPRPELATAFETAGDTAVQAIFIPPKHFKRVIEEVMPQLPKEIGGGPSSVVTKGCLWAALGVDFTPQSTARLVIQSQDPAAAAALTKKWTKALQNLARLPEVQHFVPKFSEAIDVLTPKAEGDRLVLVIDEKQKEIRSLIDSSLTAALQEARESARRAASMCNLKQLGLAMHIYHDANKHFPAAVSYSKDGKPLLSWRVMILPMIEYGELYDKFHLEEPWDSEHNKKLIDNMPPVFKSPKSKLKEPGKTNYVVPVGPGTVFESKEGMKIKDIKDGTVHTIMIVEVDDAHAVIWTKPDDLPYDPKEPAKGLGGLYEKGFNSVFCDGSPHFIKIPRPDDELRSIFSINGGEPVPNLD